VLKYRLDLKIYDEVVEINDEVKSLDKKFDVSILNRPLTFFTYLEYVVQSPTVRKSKRKS